MAAGRKAGTSSQGDRSTCTHVTQDAQRRVVRLRTRGLQQKLSLSPLAGGVVHVLKFQNDSRVRQS